MTRSIISLVAGLLFLTRFAAAQSPVASPAPTDGIRVLPRLEVVAEREKDFSGMSLTEMAARAGRVPGGAEVLGTGAFAEGRASNFKDFLGQATGVYVTSDNAGEASKLSIRGSGIQSDEPLGVQVLLDGLPMNQGDGEINLEELDLSAIQGAEILRGANALRYGSYVLGGAINFSAMTGRDHPGFRTRLEAGSFGYRRGAIGAGAATERTDAYVSVAGRRTAGFREHSAEDSVVLNGNLGRRFGPNVENRLYFGWAEWNRRLPGDLTLDAISADPFAADSEALEGDFRIHTRSHRLVDRLVFTAPNSRTEIAALFHRRQFLIHDLYERTFLLGVTEARSDNLGLVFSHSLQGTLSGRPNQFTLGLAPAHEIEHSANYRNNDGVIDRNRKTAQALTRGINFPVFFENNFSPADHVSLLAGGQFVWIDRNFEDRFRTDADGNQSARQIFRTFNPKLGFVYQHTPQDQIFFNVSRSFQPPSFDDLNPFESGTNGSTIYVPLQAQHAWSMEAGTRGGRGALEWDVTWYHAWVRNELFEINDLTGRDIGTANVPRTRHTGVEMGLDWEIFGPRTSRHASHRLTLRQEFTRNDFRFDHDPVYGTNRIAGVPVNLYEAELMFRTRQGFYAGANLEWSVTSFAADHANSVKVDPSAISGLKIGYKGGRYSVFCDLRNLADRRYVAMVKPIGDARTASPDDLAIFAPGAGRSFFAGASFEW